MAPILLSYRCGAGAGVGAGWGSSIGTATGATAAGAALVEAAAVGDEDLKRGLKDELWPSRVLAIGGNG